jgi:HEPN domain-containing protein
MPSKPRKIRPKPLEIFLIAEQFYWSGILAARVIRDAAAGDQHLQRYTHGLPNMDSAANASSAFALELYFKCLIRIGKKRPERSHNLVELFSKIAKRHQIAIRRYFNKNSSDVRKYLEREFSGRAIPEPLFDYVLTNSKDAFERMRYAYEGHPPDTGWLASDILHGARGQILSMYPNWENARQASFLNEIVIVRPTSQAH